MSNRQIFLHNDIVELVLATEDDAALIAPWFNDHDVTQYLARGHWPITLTFEREYLTKLYTDEQNLMFLIKPTGEEQPIGTVGLHKIDSINQTAEFGIVIGSKTQWSNGYGTSTLQLMLQYAFAVRNLRNVTLRVLSNNPRGKRCYEKCGFVEAGRYPEHVFKQGVWHDEIFMIAHNPNVRD